MELPNLIIGGAQKSGTTTIHKILQEHPDICFPEFPQEIHFFNIEGNYKKGQQWYKNKFESCLSHKVVAQTSPMYLFDEKTPERIFNLMPDVKLIFVLRNPVDRAYSHYWHSVKHGYEKYTFDKALEFEKERLAKDFFAYRHFSYFNRGLYSEQIERYLKYFSKSQIHVVIFEDLIKKPTRTLEEIYRFIGVDKVDGQKIPKNHNPSRIPRSINLQRLSYFLKKRAPLIARLISYLNLTEKKYDPMDASLKANLYQEYQNDIKKLEVYLGKKIEAWYLK